MTRVLMLLGLLVGVAGLQACASAERSTASSHDDGYKVTRSDIRGSR